MEKKWWKEAIVYQIYPRSFKDSNGDGIGDLGGIIEKIPYIESLGVNTIWLNPIYKSPNDDNGYDISDYYNIMNEFGTLEDFDRLLEELHKKNIKLIMDLVVNHTSDEHKWFIESEKSKDNKYSDYYIWRDSKEASKNVPPNNWTSYFRDSAWKYSEKRKQYYLHIFSKKQPDLNWENKKVVKEVYKLMKYWLDKGIDGFRMDVINFISKEDELPDGKENDFHIGVEKFTNGPRLHEFLKDMNKEVLSKYDIMTVGETGGTNPQEALEMVGASRDELNMVFQFEHMDLDAVNGNKWKIRQWNLLEWKDLIKRWQWVIDNGGWNSNYLMNHDQPRAVSRYGNDKKYRKESAKILACMTMLLPGTPYIYQGEEIAMTNTIFNSIEEVKDLDSINWYNSELKKGNRNKEKLMETINYISRDHSRTPMQWNPSINAGFSEKTPWINLNKNYKKINVENAEKEKDSVLHFYRKLIKIRKEIKAFNYGSFKMILEDNPDILAFIRDYENDKFVVILNFSEKLLEIDYQYSLENVILSNYDSVGNKNESRPYEAVVAKL